jgi:similar to stage IV sporulation protein
MLQLIRFLKGYLSIRVWGFSTERFINLCGNHNILLWDIVNHGEYYSMCISLKGFYQLKSITRKTGTRVVITSRYGLPFLTMKMKKRKMFLTGFIACFAFWLWMSGFIWNVDISGNLYITDDVFYDFLYDNGIYAGMKKKKVDIEALEKAIRNEYDIVTWTSAKIDGTKLLIQVKENDLILNSTAETEEEEKGYDILADRDGTIISIITRSGMPKVTEGDTVAKGDILVEGCIPIYNEDAVVKRYEYCRADADIMIQYRLSMTEAIQEKYMARSYTGNTITRGYCMVFGKKLSLPVFRIPYENYDILETQKQLSFLGKNRIPVYLGRRILSEYSEEEKNYTKEEIKTQFQEKLMKFIQTLDEKGVQIIEKNVTIKKYKGIWEMQADMTVNEAAVYLQETPVKPVENEQEE